MMNWATIAPESRIYKGKNLYRWDVSPGLEHHCGICAAPLHNPRAKTSCLGKHVEPCYRFHQQLHFVGKSHECFGCNASDELHHGRHKEILKIVRQITTFDQENSANLTPRQLGTASSRRGSIATSITSPTDNSSDGLASEGTKLTRRERKKAKKAGNGGPNKDKHNAEIFSRDEVDFISEAIHLKIHESKGAWEGTYIYESKHYDDEQDIEVENQTTDKMADKVDPFSVKSPAVLTPRQRKTFKKFTTPVGHASFKGGSRKFAPNTVSDPYDGVDPQILFRLGIDITRQTTNPKARKELTAKLIAAIKEDLEIIEREEAESAMREEGFWRWAGKNAYDTIKRTREDLDWATGQKKGPPRRGSFLRDDDGTAEPEGVGQLEDIIEHYPESLSPVMQRNDATFTEQYPQMFGTDFQEAEKAFVEQIASPQLELDLPADIDAKLEKAIKSKKAEKVPLSSVQQVEDEEDDGWSVVKRGKGSSKQPKKMEPRSVYRKEGEQLTITIK